LLITEKGQELRKSFYMDQLRSRKEARLTDTKPTRDLSLRTRLTQGPGKDQNDSFSQQLSDLFSSGGQFKTINAVPIQVKQPKIRLSKVLKERIFQESMLKNSTIEEVSNTNSVIFSSQENKMKSRNSVDKSLTHNYYEDKIEQQPYLTKYGARFITKLQRPKINSRYIQSLESSRNKLKSNCSMRPPS